MLWCCGAPAASGDTGVRILRRHGAPRPVQDNPVPTFVSGRLKGPLIPLRAVPNFWAAILSREMSVDRCRQSNESKGNAPEMVA